MARARRIVLTPRNKIKKRYYLFFLLSIQTILSILHVLDILKVEYIITTHRVSRIETFSLQINLGYILLTLLIIWTIIAIFQGNLKVLFFPLTSILLYPSLGSQWIISIATLLAVFGSLWTCRDFQSYFTMIFLIFNILKGISLVHWLFFLPLGFNTPFEGIAQFDMILSHITMSLGPILITLLIIISILKPFYYIRSKNEKIDTKDDSNILTNNNFLFLIIIFSIFAAIYPYLPSINKFNLNIGVDINDYLHDLNIVKINLKRRIFKVQSGSRPFFYLFVFFIQKLLNLDTLTFLRFLPVILNPLLALNIYILSKEAFNNNMIAIWSVFFTVFGYHITVSSYSSYYTNLLGLIFAFSAIGFLFKTIKTGIKKYLIITLLNTILLLFTHPWTFNQYILTLIIALVTSPIFIHDSILLNNIKITLLSRKYYLLIIPLIISIIICQNVNLSKFIKLTLLRTIPYKSYWPSLLVGTQMRFGGLLLNILIIILTIIGLLKINFSNVQETYLNVFITSTLGLFFFMNSTWKSRLFFNIPIGIFASLGYCEVYNNIKSNDLKYSFITFTIMSSIVYLFRSLANLI